MPFSRLHISIGALMLLLSASAATVNMASDQPQETVRPAQLQAWTQTSQRPTSSAISPESREPPSHLLAQLFSMPETPSSSSTRSIHQRSSPSRSSRPTQPQSAASSSPWLAFRAAMRRGGGRGVSQTTPSSQSSTSVSSQSSSSLIAPSITFNNISKNYGDANFTLAPTSDSAGSFSFSITNASVATVVGNTVTITGVGSTTITATQAANGSYAGGSANATLTVSAIAPTLGGFSNISKQMGDIPFTLTAPTSNSAGSFTYESSNTSVATVSGNTVTLVSNGTTTITATQAANGNYTSGTRTLTLTVAQGACIADPCNGHGTCTNQPGGTYSCSCTGIYSGPTCLAHDSNCNTAHGAPTDCLNGGTCVADPTGGACECPTCWTGMYCDEYDPVPAECS